MTSHRFVTAEIALTKRMKLSDIVAELKSLKDSFAGFVGDKTTAAFTGLQSKVSAIEASVSNELATATTALTEAKTTITNANAATERAQGEVNALGGQLRAACLSLKLDIKDGATSAEMITALSNGVSATLAKLNVDASGIPAGKPTSSADDKGKPSLKGRDLFLSTVKILN